MSGHYPTVHSRTAPRAGKRLKLVIVRGELRMSAAEFRAEVAKIKWQIERKHARPLP